MVLIFSIVLLLIFACGKNDSSSEKAEKVSYPILTGWLTEADIYEQIPEMKNEKRNYLPDSAAVSQLKNINEDVNVLVMLGTWCSDSRREVPRFLKIMAEIQNDHIHYEMYGLDRSKRDSLGFGEKNQIEFVPTFLIFNEDGEVDRITETPIVTIEQDLVEILSGL